MEHLKMVASVLIAMSGVGAAFDFGYIHLVKLKLHARPETRYEHTLHTLQVFLGTCSLLFIFCFNFGGPVLWIATVLVGAGILIEILDIACEKMSRRKLGGLPTFEYGIHVIASGTKLAAVVVALGIKPRSAWSWTAEYVLQEPHPAYMYIVGWIGVSTGIILTALHVWLLLAGRKALDQAKRLNQK